MKLKSLTKENRVKFYAIVAEEHREALLNEVRTNKELSLILDMYAYTYETLKNSDNIVESVETKARKNRLKGLTHYEKWLEFWKAIDFSEYTSYKNLIALQGEKRTQMVLDEVGLFEEPQFIITPLPFIMEEVDPTLSFMDKPADEWLALFGEALEEKIKPIVERRERNKPLPQTNTLDKALKMFEDKKRVYRCGLTLKEACDFAKQYSRVNEDNLKDFYLNNIDKFNKPFEDKIKKINPNLMKIDYKILIEQYFEGFKLDTKSNAPKLSKQLKAQGFDMTLKESAIFGEVKKFFTSAYDRFDKYTVLRGAIYLDLSDNSIPDIFDPWAFRGSCNSTFSSAGADTHLGLRALGTNMLKAYAVYRCKDKSVKLAPFYRAYYFHNDDGSVGHAGGYSYTCNNYNTNYELTSLLLCLKFGYKLDELHKNIKGLNNEHTSYRDCHNYTARFWANMSDLNDYSTFGNKPDALSRYEDSQLMSYFRDRKSLACLTDNNFITDDDVEEEIKNSEYVLKLGETK